MDTTVVNTDSSQLSPLKITGGFTVLMAVYHRDDPELFKKAIGSVLSNSLPPDSIILVVDGPIGRELDSVIKGFVDLNNFKVIRLASNSGLANALNVGIDSVETKWIARADADDINVPDRFALQARYMAVHPEVDIHGGGIEEVDRSGNRLAYRFTVSQHAEILKYLVNRNPFNHMTVMYKTDLVRCVGGYPDVHLKEDYALWAKMLGSGAIGGNSDDVLVVATTGREMYKRRGGLRYALAEIQLQKVLYQCKAKNLLQAISAGLLRSLVFVQPPFVRAFVYKNFLRNGG